MAEKQSKSPNKSYLLSVAGVIVLTLGSILYLTIQDYRYFVDETEEEIIDQSKRIALLTDKYFDKYRDIFIAISKSDCIMQQDSAACSNLFARLNGLFPTVENFAATDRNGRFFASGQPFDRNNPPSVEQFPFYQALKAGASSYIMNPHIGPISSDPVTGIVIPLHTESGEFDGLIGASLKLEEIERLWEGMLDQLNSNFLILDRNHNQIASSRKADLLLIDSKNMEMLKAALEQPGNQSIAVGGEKFKLYMTLSEPARWMILALIPARVPFSEYLEKRSMLEIAGAVLTLLLGLTIIISFRDAITRTRLKETKEQLQNSRRELQALAELDRSEQRYRELFQNAPVALWEEDFTQAMAHIESLVTSGVGDLQAYLESHPDALRKIAASVVILDVNKAALNMHQADSKEQLLGGLDRIFNENSYAIFMQEIIALAKGQETIELRGEVCTLKDQKRLVIARCFRLGKEREFGRLLIATSDVTELTQTEAALRRSQKMEAIGQITGGIAHDFNNILAIIIGNLDLLKMQVAGEEKSIKRVETALQAALRAADLTRQLLGFSRQQGLQSEPTDLNEALHEMKSLIDRSVTPAIEVIYRQAENLWPVSVNPGDFKDALLNLVLNAKDAMPESGRLTIQTVNRTLNDGKSANPMEPPSRDYVTLKISDTGCGIPNDAVEHIFEPFFTTKPQGKGTGLGLSMVFGFVKRSNGEIRVDSKPGEGTTFSLLLPRAQSEVKKPEPVKPEDKATPRFNKTLLVVDDEGDLLELAKNQLEAWGYSVIAVGSGQEALQQLEQNPAVDLLFTDIVMPGGMGGYELAERAVGMNPHLKLLFTSGFTRQSDRKQSKFPGSAMLNKPYNAAELSLVLGRLLVD